MCGRFVIFSQPGLLKERFEFADDPPPFEPVYNVTPGYLTPVITQQGARQANLMQWGLVPFWAQDPKIGYKMINARAEGIESKPSFRKPIRSQRCLVPADGFYEWRRVTVAGKETKVPHFIRLREQCAFAFAGIYDTWRDAAGREMRTYAIITTAPNELMATIHNRMPVILAREQEDAWLDPSARLDHVLALLQPYPAGDMEAYAVSVLVNNPRNNSQELVAPYTWTD